VIEYRDEHRACGALWTRLHREVGLFYINNIILFMCAHARYIVNLALALFLFIYFSFYKGGVGENFFFFFFFFLPKIELL
jgi:hypothetical protein